MKVLRLTGTTLELALVRLNFVVERTTPLAAEVEYLVFVLLFGGSLFLDCLVDIFLVGSVWR